jgi:hypothetical protein
MLDHFHVRITNFQFDTINARLTWDPRNSLQDASKSGEYIFTCFLLFNVVKLSISTCQQREYDKICYLSSLPIQIYGRYQNVSQTRPNSCIRSAPRIIYCRLQYNKYLVELVASGDARICHVCRNHVLPFR